MKNSARSKAREGLKMTHNENIKALEAELEELKAKLSETYTDRWGNVWVLLCGKAQGE